MERRAFLLASVGALVVRAAGAQPTRSGVVRLVLGFSPGGAADRVARVLAPELGRIAGRNVIVENIPGANSGRAIQRVTSSEPDGDTLLMATSAIAHPDHAIAMEALRPGAADVDDADGPRRTRHAAVRTTPGSSGAGSSRIRARPTGPRASGNATHVCAAELVERSARPRRTSRTAAARRRSAT
jgi:hypothetical protein